MVSTRTVVFGGTGFLGRRIVARLLAGGGEVRIAARRSRDRDLEHQPGSGGRVALVSADIRDEAATVAAVQGCDAIVNSVGLYIEEGDATFQSVHVDGAERLARIARGSGVSRLVHVSATCQAGPDHSRLGDDRSVASERPTWQSGENAGSPKSDRIAAQGSY